MADLSELAQLRIDRTPKRRSRVWLSLLGVLAVVVPIGLAVVYGGPKISGALTKPEVEVTEVALVSPAQAQIDLTSTGYVVPQRVAKVGAKVTGRITKTNIREGQEVKTGDVLFDLDPSDQK